MSKISSLIHPNLQKNQNKGVMGNINTSSPFGILYHPGTI